MKVQFGIVKIKGGLIIKYMGSKSRIAKHIVPIIQKCIDDNGIANYIEPFVGGANVIDKIKCKNRYGGDINEYLIEIYKNLDKIKTLPKEVSKEHYSKVRNCYNNKSEEFPKWYIGAIGFLASYNGRFFDGGYAGIVSTKANTIRNYYNEAKRNLESQISNLQNVKWGCQDYRELNKINNFLIYCDIPYKDTKQYNVSKNFNHDLFWHWVRDQSKNNIVIVSECQAPDDFKCIWQQEILRTVDNTKRVSSVEKLFIHNDGLFSNHFN